MADDFTVALRGVIDGVVATGGGHTLTLRYVPWGRHWDPANWPDSADESVITAEVVSDSTGNADTGSGAAVNRPEIDLHVWWPDDERITDPDAFRNAVKAALTSAIRAVEHGVGASYFTEPTDWRDVAELQGDGTTGLAHHLIGRVRGFGVEVY